MEEREKRKTRTKEEKLAEKKAKEDEMEKYGFALVDGRREKIANYKIEPPGLFLGRGSHPKAGKLKKRVLPCHVTINIGHSAPKPKSPVKDMDWKDVVHNDQVTWLAMWKENVNDQHKYVWLAASSAIKGRADRMKFETARELKVSSTPPPQPLGDGGVLCAR
jgi:DNA topoisomerase I